MTTNLRIFSRITEPTTIVLDHVFHKAFMVIDENGAEASAASASIMRGYVALVAPEPEPKVVRVDRPFLVAVQHRPSGACLFLGRVVDPR